MQAANHSIFCSFETLFLITLWLCLVPWLWLACNFSLQYHPWITLEGHENKGNDHQLKKLLIVTQILNISTLGNIKRTVWRICILMLRCKLILSGSEWLPNFLAVIVLWRLADLMEEHQEELATIESLDSGAVYTLALKTHIGMSIATLRYFAGWADKIQVSTLLTFWLICLCKVDMLKQKNWELR